jgi:hypothetical protein
MYKSALNVGLRATFVDFNIGVDPIAPFQRSLGLAKTELVLSSQLCAPAYRRTARIRSTLLLLVFFDPSSVPKLRIADRK